MFRVWAVSMRSTHPLKMTRNYCWSIKNSEESVKSKSPNSQTFIYLYLFILNCLLARDLQSIRLLTVCFFSLFIILELQFFLTETMIRKLRLQRSLVTYTLNLGRLLRYISCVNYFLYKLFLYSIKNGQWNLSLS